jgi:hypothetical protein
MLSLPAERRHPAKRAIAIAVRSRREQLPSSGMMEGFWGTDGDNQGHQTGSTHGSERGRMLDSFPAHPARLGARSMRLPAATFTLLREALIIVVAVFLYFAVRGLVETRVWLAHEHARAIVDLERRLGIFVEPDLQQLIVPHDWLVALANWVYIYGHWPVVALTLVWLHMRHGAAYPRFRNALLISGALGLIVFATYPVAPPRFLPDLGFWDSVSARSESYRVLQPPSLVNKYAAMPSLHFGWNLLMGIAWAQYATTRAGRVFGWLMPVAMLIAIVVTANHYLLDGAAGGALALVGLAIATTLAVRPRAAAAPRTQSTAPHPAACP